MTTGTVAPHRARLTPERESFWRLVRAELTKFRTVRGWVIAVLLTIVAITAFVFVASDVSSSCAGTGGPSACPVQPTGPGGVPVIDAFYFAHQPVTGNGTITVQMTSLTGQVEVGQAGHGAPQLAPGLQPWSKAGIIIKENTTLGSVYAAMMVTGSNGVRMQWDYVNDTPGPGKGAGEAGRASSSASAPRWLRLVRSGGTITGYDSADGTHWALVAAATIPGLTSTVQAGLFAAGSYHDSNSCTYDSDFCTRATGVFRHIGLSWPATGWTGTNVGGSNFGVPAPGMLRQSAGTLTVASFGDIGPAVGSAYGGNGLSLQRALAGTFFGMIPLIVVAAMFITAEYRRKLIWVSLTAAPRRGRLLAAKAVAIGAVGFVAGLVAATLAIAVGLPLLRRAGPGLAGFAAHRGSDGRRHRGAARRGRGARARDRHHRGAQRAGDRHRDRGNRRPLSARLPPGVAGARQRPGRGRRLAAADHPGRRLVRTAGGSAVPSAHRQLFAG